MKKFLSLCLASLMILASASTVLADDGIMLISETEAVADQIVIDDVNAPKTAPIYAYGNGVSQNQGQIKAAYPNRPGQVGNVGGIWFPKQVTIKVEAGENGSVDVPAKFYAAVTSSRTFNITPDKGYEVADITVNGVSYGPAYSVKLKNIQVAMDIKVTFEPKLVYTPVYEEDFAGETSNWQVGGQLENFAIADGALNMTSVGGDPIIMPVENFNLNADDVDVIRIRYKNATGNANVQVFFTSDSNPNLSEAGSFKATAANVDGTEWNEIVIDTSVNELWAGTIGVVRLDLASAEGALALDYISFETVSLDIAE